MKLYLSSYKLGEYTSFLSDWIKETGNSKIALILNAGDAFVSTEAVKTEKRKGNVDLLKSVGFDPTVFDLRDYFNKEQQLINDLKDFHAFFAVGGNTYVLRQAMKLSGFDKYLLSIKNKENYLYGGWSAGICVLAKSFAGLELVDEPSANPYNYATINEGLGLLNYLPIPHYKSNHPESERMDKVVAYMCKNKLPHKTLCDGDVIIYDILTRKEQIQKK